MTREQVLRKEFQAKIDVFDEYQKLTDKVKIFKATSCEMAIRFAEKYAELNIEVPQRIIDYYETLKLEKQ